MMKVPYADVYGEMPKIVTKNYDSNKKYRYQIYCRNCGWTDHCMMESVAHDFARNHFHPPVLPPLVTIIEINPPKLKQKQRPKHRKKSKDIPS